MEDILFASLGKLAQLIRYKHISSHELTQAYLHRIESVNPKLNAIVHLREEVLSEAQQLDDSLMKDEIKGPLHGIPITIKDNISVMGAPCTSGSQGLSSYVPDQDATVVARLKAAGAIVLGKTNLPEFGFAYESDNVLFGPSNNPYNSARSSGGSSGGESAIIAAGGSPLGLGNDGGGSIRLPSHWTGIAGIKPTTGRCPRTGHSTPPAGVLSPLWQVGPMGRYVNDLMITLPIMAGPDGYDPLTVPMPLKHPKELDLSTLRAVFYTDNGIVRPTDETIEAVKKTAAALAEEGVKIEEKRPGGMEPTVDMWLTHFGADDAASFLDVLDKIGTKDIHSLTQQGLDACRRFKMNTAEFFGFLFKLDTFRSEMLTFMEDYDLIICPVSASPALEHGQTWKRIDEFSYTMTYNLTGWPGAVVRVATSSEQLPIGVQLVSKPWREDIALATAERVEQLFGGFHKPLI